MPKGCGSTRIGHRDASPPARRVHVQFNAATCPKFTNAADAAVPPGTALHHFLQEPPKFSKRGGQGTTRENSNQTNPQTRDPLVTPRPNETSEIVSNSSNWMFDETARAQFFHTDLGETPADFSRRDRQRAGSFMPLGPLLASTLR